MASNLLTSRAQFTVRSHLAYMSSAATAWRSLIREKAFVNGQWVDAKDGKTFPVLNKATGELIGHVPDMGTADTVVAIEAAHKAFTSWRERSAKERSQIMRKYFQLITDNTEALAQLITAENGKVLADARGETTYGAGFIEWFSEEARRVYGTVVASPIPTKRYLVLHQPIGVVGMITPWNFPVAMITRKAGAAIAAGCTTVVKPAEDTPFTALALAQLAKEAGVPDGVFNVVTASRERTAEVGHKLCTCPLVRQIGFTGSVPVGKLLLSQSADTVKRVSLELGGNAPFIVFKSANLDLAVQGAMASKFRCSGQTCVCANRIFVQEEVHDAFVQKLTAAVSKMVVGDGFDADVHQGPLINNQAFEKVDRIVTDSVKAGARVAVGGSRAKVSPGLKGAFYEPTILTDCTPAMPCVAEEIFGPVASIVKFRTEEEVITVANKARVGLAGYFYTNDPSQAWRVAERLEVGMVGINEGIISSQETPFGGVKESGLGREGGPGALEEFMETKYVCWGGLQGQPTQ